MNVSRFVNREQHHGSKTKTPRRHVYNKTKGNIVSSMWKKQQETKTESKIAVASFLEGVRREIISLLVSEREI